MAYSSIQFIGYVIDTAPQLNADGSQTCLGLGNPQQDVQARCQLMLRAMEAAAASLPQASPPEPPGTTLKVFMAPEFFFRGTAGAYQLDDVRLAITTLQQMAGGAQWNDWMFVFGTVAGTLAANETSNFCLVQQGGVASPGDSGAGMVMKELQSNIVAIASAAHPGGVLVGAVSPGRPNQQVGYDGAGIFQLCGITWGLDICLDGNMQRVLRSPRVPGSSVVQVQLVPSCGTDADAGSVACEAGGLVFHCDGMRDTAQSTLALLQPPMSDVAMASSMPVPGDALPLPGASPAQAVPVSSLYAQGPGTLDCYPPQAVPNAGTVPGSVVRLSWPASPQWTFNFLLVYATNGSFDSIRCEIAGKTVDFHGNNYTVPLQLSTRDAVGNTVQVQMSLIAGSGPYAGALWCRIEVPGFVFEGNAFEFSAVYGGMPPYTVW
ncbi:MAG: hypothetical protein V4864_09180 [Pseudomonadota bacterium]